MKRILVSIAAVACLMCAATYSFAGEMGNMVNEMKGEMKADVDAMKDEMKAGTDAMKGNLKGVMGY
ncbi:MAG: hypothetical protein ACT4PN_01150 [Nitrospiraceae bacterium]